MSFIIVQCAHLKILTSVLLYLKQSNLHLFSVKSSRSFQSLQTEKALMSFTPQHIHPFIVVTKFNTCWLYWTFIEQDIVVNEKNNVLFTIKWFHES